MGRGSKVTTGLSLITQLLRMSLELYMGPEKTKNIGLSPEISQ